MYKQFQQSNSSFFRLLLDHLWNTKLKIVYFSFDNIQSEKNAQAICITKSVMQDIQLLKFGTSDMTFSQPV